MKQWVVICINLPLYSQEIFNPEVMKKLIANAQWENIEIEMKSRGDQTKF